MKDEEELNRMHQRWALGRTVDSGWPEGRSRRSACFSRRLSRSWLANRRRCRWAKLTQRRFVGWKSGRRCPGMVRNGESRRSCCQRQMVVRGAGPRGFEPIQVDAQHEGVRRFARCRPRGADGNGGSEVSGTSPPKATPAVWNTRIFYVAFRPSMR